MIVLISARLSEPPSHVTLFRDITLYSSCFLKNKNILECQPHMKDIYWNWLKKHGAWDFIDDIIERDSEVGITIRRRDGTICVPSINYNNFQDINARLAAICLR
mgnify:CR=1|jgi:hypothetical protein